MTNHIFFSENLCKVGSSVLTPVLFVWHLCPLLARSFLHKWVVFVLFCLKERYSLKYGDSFRIKRSTDITHPLVVSEKVHGWVYVLVQDTKNQVCAAEHASTSSSLYLTGSQNETIGVFLFCFVFFFFKKMCINANKNE